MNQEKALNGVEVARAAEFDRRVTPNVRHYLQNGETTEFAEVRDLLAHLAYWGILAEALATGRAGKIARQDRRRAAELQSGFAAMRDMVMATYATAQGHTEEDLDALLVSASAKVQVMCSEDAA